MSTNHLNQTDFAKKMKVTRQAVNKAIREGKLILHGKGRASYIDMDCKVTKLYIRNGSINRHIKNKGKPRSKPKTKPPKKKEKESAPESTEHDESAQAFTDKIVTDRDYKRKQTEKIDLEIKARRGELIERYLVQQFIEGLHIIDNGQWKTLGLKVSADVAAVFGIDDEDKIRAACEVIDKETLAILKQVKRESNKFLKKIGAKQIKKQTELELDAGTD
jgi:hypothetical protein